MNEVVNGQVNEETLEAKTKALTEKYLYGYFQSLLGAEQSKKRRVNSLSNLIAKKAMSKRNQNNRFSSADFSKRFFSSS